MSNMVLDESVDETERGILYPFMSDISMSTSCILTLCVSCWAENRNVIRRSELASIGFCPTAKKYSYIQSGNQVLFSLNFIDQQLMHKSHHYIVLLLHNGINIMQFMVLNE